MSPHGNRKAVVKASKIDVRELSESDAAEIEVLFKKVWSKAYEYPKEWRQRRILTEKQISKEMEKGYRYFGIRLGNRLAGVYKALITNNNLFGEHQTVAPEFRGLGLAARAHFVHARTYQIRSLSYSRIS
jgi:hypothetical protein